MQVLAKNCRWQIPFSKSHYLLFDRHTTILNRKRAQPPIWIIMVANSCLEKFLEIKGGVGLGREYLLDSMVYWKSCLFPGELIFIVISSQLQALPASWQSFFCISIFIILHKQIIFTISVTNINRLQPPFDFQQSFDLYNSIL